MPRKQYVVRKDDKWGIRAEGSVIITKIFDTKKEAVDYGIVLAKKQKTSLFIQWKSTEKKGWEDVKNYTKKK